MIRKSVYTASFLFAIAGLSAGCGKNDDAAAVPSAAPSAAQASAAAAGAAGPAANPNGTAAFMAGAGGKPAADKAPQ